MTKRETDILVAAVKHRDFGPAPLTPRQQAAQQRLREAVDIHCGAVELSMFDGCRSPGLTAAKHEVLAALREVQEANAPEPAPETARPPSRLTENETNSP